ncbi:membrane protein [Vibrio ishigakensis]|uniref:Membrane protein n=1 Tax=Vibrio ishigakensis TaxID=1481914 RepID=A0A0B8QSY9_9VIBR|nr:membrane protein [Vibrio ishigakensis]
MVFLFLAMLSFQWLNSSHSPLETNILKLLPSNQQNPVAEQAFESVSNDLSDKVIFVVSSDSTDNTYKAANSLTHSLKALGIFDEVVGKIAQDQQNAWANYYFSHRFQQLTPQQRERLSNQPSAQIQYVVQSVYNPFSGVTGRELSEDPFLIFRDYLAQLSKLNSAFTIKNDFLSTQYQGRDYVLVTATLDGSPYSLSAQQGVPEIIRIENTLAERYKANIYHTGVLFFAEFGTQSAKSEISTIGLFSLLGIIVLIIGVFRSLAPLGLALLSITVGVLAALAVTTWVFGHVHLFSLVFGASLLVYQSTTLFTF